MSGKTARRLRKNHVFSKKTLALCAGLCISCAPINAGGQFLVSVFPHFTMPFGESHSMEYGIGAGLRATYRPIKFLNLFAEGDYLSMALPGVDPVMLLEGSIGTGYHIDLTDRMALDFNINVGAYNAKTSKSVAGISAGGALVFSYKLNPVISLDVAATASHYAGKPSPLMMVNAGVAPGVTFNITQIFNHDTHIDVETKSLSPVFPVLYSWYENNSFGQVDITNREDSAITDVTVSFFQPQYMAHAKECATIKRIKKGETVPVDLVAFFNEQMLELTEKADTNSYIIVNYSLLGRKLSQSYALDVPVYGRNNMSWDDDRRAAVFVSSKDPAAMQFGKYTASIVRDNLRVDVPVNIQYALGIFEALNQFGINYVVDPSSAFEDNVGTSSIDFLQFPYQTLMYRGGDCDDLSILVCSLFEAVGIDTAFITVPGHIFMAFDSGLTPEQARMILKNPSDFIFVDNEVWVPLEITLSDEGFYKACRYGAREWNTAAAQGTAALYKMRDSWTIYQPISVPGATAYFNMPEGDAITLAFETGIDRWGRSELNTTLADYTVKYAMLQENTEEDKTVESVLKDTPLTEKALLEIMARSNTVAVVPASGRKKDSDSSDEYDDLEGGNGDDEEDELIEDIFPLDFAIATATLQTDVAVKTAESEEFVLAETEEETGLEELEDLSELALTGAVVSKVSEPENVVSDSDNVVSDSDNEVTLPDSDVTEHFEDVDSFTEDLEVAAEKAENFETVEDFTAALEEAAESSTRHTPTTAIVIISSVTVTAALAAGIIINRKKKRRG